MIDYIKLARQAGIDVLEVESERASMWPATPEGLAKFAELVQAAERERMCAAIKAADDKASEGDYMLDSDDCISVIRGTWNP
jgi:hypothetical protein